MLAAFSDRNPWHVCFAVGLCWGRLAKFEPEFVGAAINLLENWNAADLKFARTFHYERGPEPIEQSLAGGNKMFDSVVLPEQLPDDLEKYRRVQERWLGRILGKDRPKYIGSWNATAMFMVALFSNKVLADKLVTPIVMLPPGGPIYNGLSILHQTHVLSTKPAGSELDDQAFEPGAIYENNALFVEILRGKSDWNLLDVHSGLYMLGTRLAESDGWF
ncbi:hypothetical protein H261_20739 [Paramagnetospirillum caucaseum]|uniref:Uncharacterized protein n=2 Tax=Paramagnetospirillum caucaseum TaxID=1244869 RepID=M3A567_9PROT|nr:hypothetical protein H261_20739 [Paramagnetospirillum caucaseum]